jgi:ABC-type antimicrobial peptide transport system permease subunit
VFALITTLAAGGLFSVFSYAVSRRLREFGIRSALGGQPHQIRRHVVGDAARITMAGLSIGVLAARLLARSLASLEFGVSAADPVTWMTVVAVLAATTLLATWRPARQASRVDPVSLLRDA